MLDVFEVADALVDHVKTVYPEDVALIAYYGSYAHGTATPRSDLDFFFIPATSRGYQASLQFIIDGIGFDFWPIDWERAGRMASFKEEKTGIIADCKLLYVRSEEDRDRFMMLRETIPALKHPESAGQRVEKAETQLRDAYVHLYKLSRAGDSGSITFCRIEAHEVLTKVMQSLALINGTYYTKGFGKNIEQLRQFALQPASLQSLMDTIMHSEVNSIILQACEELVADTLEVVLLQKRTCLGTPSYPDRIQGYYEEAKGVLDKIITACERSDYNTAFFSAVHAQEEIAHLLFFAETGQWASELAISSASQDLYRLLGLPELIATLDSRDFMPLLEAVEQLSARMESLLRSKGVAINRFDSINQFAAFLQHKGGIQP